MDLTKEISGYDSLVDNIGHLLAEGRRKAIQSVNSILVQTYWEIGRYIVEFEQKGNERAEYAFPSVSTKYQIYLPKKEELQNKLIDLIFNDEPSS